MSKRSRKPVNYIALSGNKGKTRSKDEEPKPKTVEVEDKSVKSIKLRDDFLTTADQRKKGERKKPQAVAKKQKVYSLDDFMKNVSSQEFEKNFEKDNIDESEFDNEFDQVTRTTVENNLVPDVPDIEIVEIQDIDEKQQQEGYSEQDYDDVVMEDISQNYQEESPTSTKMKTNTNEMNYSNEIMITKIEDDEEGEDHCEGDNSTMKSNASTCSSTEKSPRSRDKRIEYSGLCGNYWNMNSLGNEKRRASRKSFADILGIKKKNKTPEKQPQPSPPKSKQKYTRKNKSYTEEPSSSAASRSLFDDYSRSFESTGQEKKLIKRKSETFIPQRVENNKKQSAIREGRDQIDDNNFEFEYNRLEKKDKKYQESINDHQREISTSRSKHMKSMKMNLDEFQHLSSLSEARKLLDDENENISQFLTSIVKPLEKSPSYSIIKDKVKTNNQLETMMENTKSSNLKLKLKLVSEKFQEVEKSKSPSSPEPEMPSLSPISIGAPEPEFDTSENEYKNDNEYGTTRARGTRIMTRKRKSIDKFYVSKKDVIISALSVPKEFATKPPINFLNDIKSSVEKTDYKEIVDFSVKKKIIKKPIDPPKVQQKPKQSTEERQKLMRHLGLDKPVKRKLHYKEKLIRKEILDGKRKAHVKDTDFIINFDPEDEAKSDSSLIQMSPSEEIAQLPSPFTLSEIESLQIKGNVEEDVKVSVICKMTEGACRLGCVCLSLSFPAVDKEHCGKPRCLLRCKCNDPDASEDEELDIRTRLRPRVSILNWKDIHKNNGFGKIDEDDDGSSRPRKRRSINAPKHFGDFVMEDENGVPVKRGSKKALELMRKQNKILAQQNQGGQQQKKRVMKKRADLSPQKSPSVSPSKSKRAKKDNDYAQNVTGSPSSNIKRKVNHGNVKYNRDLILTNLKNAINKLKTSPEAISMQEETMKGSDYNEIYKLYENQGNELCYFGWNFSQNTPPLVARRYHPNGLDSDKILILPIPNIGHQWLIVHVDQYFLDKSFMVVPMLRVIIDTEELNEAIEWANENDVTTVLKMPNYPKALGKLYVLPHLPRLIAIGPVNCDFYKNIMESDALNDSCYLGSRFLSICQDNEKSEDPDIMQCFQDQHGGAELNEADYRECIEPIPPEQTETILNALQMTIK